MNGRFLKLLAMTALASAALFGSTVTMSFGNASSAFPDGSIGPYVASVGGITEFVYCDDDTHVVYPNETWTATVTSLSALVTLGNNNIASGSSVLWKSVPNAATLYQEAAWLVNEFTIQSADSSGIQNAIWDLFLQKSGTGSTTDKTTDAYWLLQASTNYTSLTAAQIADTVILTPIAGSQMPSSYGLPQEFITTTPEPATFAIFGAGLILVSL